MDPEKCNPVTPMSQFDGQRCGPLVVFFDLQFFIRRQLDTCAGCDHKL
jgi:hypothetical protein